MLQLLQAYAAARAVPWVHHVRLAAACDGSIGPAISQRPPPSRRTAGLTLLNRVLLDPSEVEVTREAQAVAWLGAEDARTVHVREHLKPEPNQPLRAGLLDAGTTDDARAEWVHDGEGDATVEGAALKLELGPAEPLLRPVAEHERPRVDVLLAMPRPLVFGRLLPMLSSMGVGTLWVTGAQRVDKHYFSSHYLRPDREAELRAALVNGLEQSGETAVPRCVVRRDLRGLLRDEFSSPELAEAKPSAPPLVRLVCHPERLGEEAADVLPLGDALSDVAPDARVLLAIGPERGWAEPEELDMFERHGFQPVTLGTRTLRTDVAVVSLLAVAHERLEAATRRAEAGERD